MLTLIAKFGVPKTSKKIDDPKGDKHSLFFSSEFTSDSDEKTPPLIKHHEDMMQYCLIQGIDAAMAAFAKVSGASTVRSVKGEAATKQHSAMGTSPDDLPSSEVIDEVNKALNDKGEGKPKR